MLIALCPAYAKEADPSIFYDPVNYSGWSTGPLPMEAISKSKSGSRPNIVTIAPDNTGFDLNNGVIFTRLPRNADHRRIELAEACNRAAGKTQKDRVG